MFLVHLLSVWLYTICSVIHGLDTVHSIPHSTMPIPYALPVPDAQNNNDSDLEHVFMRHLSQSHQFALSVFTAWSVAIDQFSRLQAELAATQEISEKYRMELESKQMPMMPRIPRLPPPPLQQPTFDRFDGEQNAEIDELKSQIALQNAQLMTKDVLIRLLNDTLSGYGQPQSPRSPRVIKERNALQTEIEVIRKKMALMKLLVSQKNEELQRKDAFIKQLGVDVASTSSVMQHQFDTITKLRHSQAIQDEKILNLNSEYLRELTQYNRKHHWLRQQMEELRVYRNTSRLTIQRLQTLLNVERYALRNKSDIIRSMHVQLESERQRKDAALGALLGEQTRKRMMNASLTQQLIAAQQETHALRRKVMELEEQLADIPDFQTVDMSHQTQSANF